MKDRLENTIRRKEIKWPCTMRGQSLIESYIVLPLFAFLMFGVLELAYMYHAKTTLNAATFDAARSGSLHNAKISAMYDAMAKAISALYLRKDPNVANALLAYSEAKIAITAGRGKIDIISPTKDVFRVFKKNDYLTEDQTETKKDHIPNDNLMWRNADYRTITSGGATLKVNLQDANLLKIRTTWCHKLVVPVLNKVIHAASILTANKDQLACDVYSKAASNISGTNEYYIAITSSAIIRMQSAVLEKDLK